MAQELEKAGITTKKIVVPLGVNLKYFMPARSKGISKKKIHISRTAFVIGYLGRIAREKNLNTLYQAFLKVHEKYPKTQLLIVGDGLKEEKDKLEHKNVIIAGNQNDTVPFYQAMDIFVLPSLTETSSLVTMEAMACGIPPIVTPVGHLRDYIHDGDNGFIFPINDDESLAKKLMLLIKDKKKRESMGRKARQTAMKNFSWWTTAKKLKKCLSL